MSNTLALSSASPGVSRSNRKVPRPAACSTSATYRLRGLFLPLPLPWANSTIPGAFGGTVRYPLSRTWPTAGATSPAQPA